ncbi:MAG: hypothetical protein ABR538_14080, partial [Candidatus Binatia bacterium]
MKRIPYLFGAFTLALAALAATAHGARAESATPAAQQEAVAAADGEAAAEEAGEGEAAAQADQKSAEKKEEEGRRRLPIVSVIGSKEAQLDLVGSGTYVTEEEISTQNYQDINRVMRR